VTTSIPESTGTFRFSRRTAAWTWSENLYHTFGFAPGDVVPTQDLILSHLHPEDRAAVQQVFEDSLETGRPHSVWHRLVNAHGSTRQVVTLCAGDFAEDGTLVGVSGFLVDLTEHVRRTTAREVDEAMELMSQSRPVIEQAKGALMVTYGLDADDAFLLLRRYSQQVNVKLRDVARTLVEGLPRGSLPHDSRVLWDALAAGLTGSLADAEQQAGA
jgi:PAS domain S-box-containing protein